MNHFDYLAAERQRLQTKKDTIAQKLRAMADEIDRIPVIDAAGDHRPPTAIVAQVVHAVTWGVANLHLDSLVTHAGSIEETRRYEEEQARS